MDIEAIIDRLVRCAESEDRPLIGWSTHEIDVVERYCPPELARRFRERYVDGKAVAKAARRSLRVALPAARGREMGHTLARYMQVVGHEVPWVFGPGWTGTTILILEPALARHGDWARLTPRQKMRWSFLLGHNRHDLVLEPQGRSRGGPRRRRPGARAPRDRLRRFEIGETASG